MVDVVRLPATTQPRKSIPFLFFSYRNLLSDLGAIDALGASLTIASHHFIDSARAGTDDQLLGKQLARQYRISASNFDLNTLPTHLARLLMIGTSKHLENFLTRFRREQRALHRMWRNKRDGEPDLKYVLSCLPGGFDLNRKRIGTERYDLLEYYRLLRNDVAHPDIDVHRLKAEHQNVMSYQALVKREFGLAAPNLSEAVTFHDHLLYTRLVKYVATDLCRLAPPRGVEELKQVLGNRESFPPTPAGRILIRRGNEAALRRAINAFFKDNYLFDLAADPDAEDRLVRWVESLPRRKARRKAGRPVLSEALPDYLADEADAKI